MSHIRDPVMKSKERPGEGLHRARRQGVRDALYGQGRVPFYNMLTSLEYGCFTTKPEEAGRVV